MLLIRAQVFVCPLHRSTVLYWAQLGIWRGEECLRHFSGTKISLHARTKYVLWVDFPSHWEIIFSKCTLWARRSKTISPLSIKGFPIADPSAQDLHDAVWPSSSYRTRRSWISAPIDSSLRESPVPNLQYWEIKFITKTDDFALTLTRSSAPCNFENSIILFLLSWHWKL